MGYNTIVYRSYECSYNILYKWPLATKTLLIMGKALKT